MVWFLTKSLEKKPEALNLLNIYSEISKINLENVLKEMSGKEYSFVKNKLAELLVSEVCPVGKKINKLMKDKAYLLEILKNCISRFFFYQIKNHYKDDILGLDIILYRLTIK